MVGVGIELEEDAMEVGFNTIWRSIYAKMNIMGGEKYAKNLQSWSYKNKNK